MEVPFGRRAETFTLALAGDVMLGRGVADTVQQRGVWWPWGDVLPRVRAADLFCVNLECALTERTERAADDRFKSFFFRAPPTAVESLRCAGVDFCGLANNHVCDYGPEGLLDTIAALEDVGIAHAGAGAELHAARVPARIVRKGWRVSVVACADNPSAWAAGPRTPGIHWVPVPATPEMAAFLQAQVAAERAHADLVVFCVHWGPNMRDRPDAEFRAFARGVVDAGADVFWGHSAHVVQGIELRNGRPILYDTGDLVDDFVVDRWLRNDLGGLFLLRFGPEGFRELEVVPVRIGWRQARLAEQGDRTWLLGRLAELSRELGTDLAVDGRRGLVRVGVPA